MKKLIRDRFQISLQILSKSKQIDELLFPLKSSENLMVYPLGHWITAGNYSGLRGSRFQTTRWLQVDSVSHYPKARQMIT